MFFIIGSNVYKNIVKIIVFEFKFMINIKIVNIVMIGIVWIIFVIVIINLESFVYFVSKIFNGILIKVVNSIL